ncbi:MAG: oligosaccharide flippase family protein [Deltaproteobacteria bacterium]|nr:oligosaccharide flippase family protein [Deltaproteobacteria bacterium]
MRGGVYLSIRQVLGIVVGIWGVLFLTKTIGPGAYGLYSAALGIYLYIYQIFRLGIGVYLIRGEKELPVIEFHQAFCCLFLLGILGTIIGILILPVLKLWVSLDGLVAIIFVLLLMLPLHLLTAVPIAIIERALNYRYIALIETGGQILYYLIALPMALGGFGAWAPVTGWWMQHIAVFIMVLVASKYRPKFIWDWTIIGRMGRYGLSFSSSIWVWQLRSLVNPLVVGRLLGAECVGYVALAIYIVESLSFVKDVTWRLSIAAMARLQNDKARLARVIGEGMLLQVTLLGLILVFFTVGVIWLLPLYLGKIWYPVITIFPFIALSYLTNSLFNLHSSALYVIHRNWEVTLFHLFHIAMFTGGVILLIPNMGLLGYGVAEVIALPSYWLIHYYVRVNIGTIKYKSALIPYFGLVLPLFYRELGLWTFIGITIIMLWPNTFRTLRKEMVNIRGGQVEK